MSADIAETDLEANDSDPFACYGTDSEYEPSNSSSSGPLKPTSSPQNQKTRKMKRNMNSWRRVESKRQKNSGKQYKNAVGQLIPSKVMKSGCTLKCRLKCHERVPHDTRLDIFNNYYKLGNKERQWDFVSKGVKVIDKKVTKISTSSRRNSSRIYYLNYYLNDKYESTRVCLKMFLDTLAVSSQIVDTALRKCTAGGGVDNRGKYVRPVNEVKQVSKKLVLDHISAFPIVESHYTRAHSTKNFLDSDLSVAKLYRLYVKWIEDKQIQQHIVTERQYRDIFNFNFNLSFFKPKKDQCNNCTSFGNMSPSDKEKFKFGIEKHLKMKNEARRLKDIDKAAATVHTNIVAACFDFQKVLQCPFGETSIFFYKRKLNLHNFTIYNLVNRQGYCYLWDETVARQGACEVASCLYKLILENINKNSVNKFIFWTDNCPGQNKNKVLFTFYSWISKKLKVDIHHKFLEKGHTQNEGDSMHSTIEKCRKNKTIYIPAQYYSLIRNAKISGSTYMVHEVEQNEIMNFKKLSGTNFFAKNSENQVFSISKVREIYISKDEPNKLFYKYDFDENFREVTLYYDETSTTKRRGRKRKTNRDVVDSLYSQREPISECKYQDLMFLCKNNYIPGFYHQMFQNLPHSNSLSQNDSHSSC